LTNRTEDVIVVEAEHRDHAVVEQVIADLKDQALAHFPSGHCAANGAWTVLACLAHNLLRWTQLIGLPDSAIARAALATAPRIRGGWRRDSAEWSVWALHCVASGCAIPRAGGRDRRSCRAALA
jgi:hypothetical protein